MAQQHQHQQHQPQQQQQQQQQHQQLSMRIDSKMALVEDDWPQQQQQSSSRAKQQQLQQWISNVGIVQLLFSAVNTILSLIGLGFTVFDLSMSGSGAGGQLWPSLAKFAAYSAFRIIYLLAGGIAFSVASRGVGNGLVTRVTVTLLLCCVAALVSVGEAAWRGFDAATDFHGDGAGLMYIFGTASVLHLLLCAAQFVLCSVQILLCLRLRAKLVNC